MCTPKGDKVNFFIHYDGEKEPAPHVLRLSAYNTSDGADYDSWLLYEKQEMETEPTEAHEDA